MELYKHMNIDVDFVVRLKDGDINMLDNKCKNPDCHRTLPLYRREDYELYGYCTSECYQKCEVGSHIDDQV